MPTTCAQKDDFINHGYIVRDLSVYTFCCHISAIGICCRWAKMPKKINFFVPILN